MKNNRKKRKIKESNEIIISDKRVIAVSEVKKQYNKYYNDLKRLDNINIKCIKSQLNKKNTFLNLLDSKDRVVELFNKEIKNKIPSKNRDVLQIVLDEHLEDIERRKVSNRLENPHYFFTNKYIEKSRPSQVRH